MRLAVFDLRVGAGQHDVIEPFNEVAMASSLPLERLGVGAGAKSDWNLQNSLYILQITPCAFR